MRNGWHILCYQGVYQVPMSKYHANLVDLLKPGEAKTAGNARKPVLTYRAAVLWQPRLQSGAGCSDSWGVRLPALIGITICSTGKLNCALTGAMSPGRGAEPPGAGRTCASRGAPLNHRLG